MYKAAHFCIFTSLTQAQAKCSPSTSKLRCVNITQTKVLNPFESNQALVDAKEAQPSDLSELIGDFLHSGRCE
jgi:hypothetical protein